MEFGKYIIVKNGGIPTPILFPSHLNHADVAEGFGTLEILSAGMFEVGADPTETDPDSIGVSVFGESVTLGKQVNKREDPDIIQRLLRKQYHY
jgi:hypothetical protein